MNRYRTIAIPTSTAEAVRATMHSPLYGHPAHVEVATGYGPCRHCLRTFRVGAERRILFTYNPFDALEPFPLPGPVFVHKDECERYPEDGGFPAELRAYPLTLSGYGHGRILREQVHVDGSSVEMQIERLLTRAEVDYIHIRDTTAGCYDLRVERADAGNGGNDHEAVPSC